MTFFLLLLLYFNCILYMYLYFQLQLDKNNTHGKLINCCRTHCNLRKGIFDNEIMMFIFKWGILSFFFYLHMPTNTLTCICLYTYRCIHICIDIGKRKLTKLMYKICQIFPYVFSMSQMKYFFLHIIFFTVQAYQDFKP